MALLKSTVRSSSRTGVPVFMRCTVNPRARSCSVIPCEAGSETRPPSICTGPTCINPLRKVPAVNTTDLAVNSTPKAVFTPFTTPFSMVRLTAESCHIYRLGVFSRILRHSAMKRMRSACERGLHMAGPFERFNMRNWIELRSVTIPI